MDTPKTVKVPEQAQETPRQPYEKPAVIYRAPLEAVAGQCTPQPPGKVGGTPGCTSPMS